MLHTEIDPSLDDKVKALRTAATYACGTTVVETIETHFAWIFLTRHHAYKLKKPVRLEGMDHTAKESRHRNCLEELRLNRRLAPDIYLDVVPLICNSQGAIGLRGEGQVVDWLVKMKRLPSELLLDNAIKADRVTHDDIRKVAVLLTSFYAKQPPIKFEPNAYLNRVANQVLTHRTDLISPDLRMPLKLVDAVFAIQNDFLKRHASLVQSRAAEDRIVEAHGDLRPEHVFIGEPACVIDCLEFSRDLRLMDPLEELAFFAMECDHLNASWIGNELLAHFAQLMPDAASHSLFDFYKSHRAAHRALITAWHLRDAEVSCVRDWQALAEAYLNRAIAYLPT